MFSKLPNRCFLEGNNVPKIEHHPLACVGPLHFHFEFSWDFSYSDFWDFFCHVAALRWDTKTLPPDGVDCETDVGGCTPLHLAGNQGPHSCHTWLGPPERTRIKEQSTHLTNIESMSIPRGTSHIMFSGGWTQHKYTNMNNQDIMPPSEARSPTAIALMGGADYNIQQDYQLRLTKKEKHFTTKVNACNFYSLIHFYRIH